MMSLISLILMFVGFGMIFYAVVSYIEATHELKKIQKHRKELRANINYIKNYKLIDYSKEES